METERFAVPEVLFCPSDVGINQVRNTMLILLLTLDFFVFFVVMYSTVSVIYAFSVTSFAANNPEQLSTCSHNLFSGWCRRICLAESQELASGEFLESLFNFQNFRRLNSEYEISLIIRETINI